MRFFSFWRSFIFGITQTAISTGAKDGYYIVKGGLDSSCSDLDCTTRVFNSQETGGVRCCADDYPGSHWTYVDSCDIWVVSHLFVSSFPMCFMTTWAKAIWYCDKAGGRLCTKNELENGCAANNGSSGCGFDSYMIWSSTTGELPEDTYSDSNTPVYSAAASYYVAQGRSDSACWESSCSTTIVSQYEVKAVRCCSETNEEDDWVSKCGIWADSDIPFCYLVDWHTANSICSEAGGRLCTKTEVENDCTVFTGCYFDAMLVWTSDGAPTVDPTDSPTKTPTDPPTLTPTDPPTITPTDPPTKTPTASVTFFGIPLAKWVKVGCNTDGVYTEVIKDQIIREKSPQISLFDFHKLLLTELIFEGEKVKGKTPWILARTWEVTHSVPTSHTYRCDYFDNLMPFTGGCMWRLEVVVSFWESRMIWMPHVIKCSKAQPKCAPLIACSDEDCSQCKHDLLSFQNTITYF